MPKLTDALIAREAAKNTGTDRTIMDTMVPALALRVRPSGATSYSARFYLNGKRKQVVLGKTANITLRAARKAAQEYVEGAATGRDLAAEIKAKADAARVEAVAREWLEKHAVGKTSERAIRGYIENDVIPSLGSLRPEEVTTAAVYDMIEKKAKSAPRSAAVLLNYTRKLFDYAAIKGHIAVNPVGALKPKDIPGLEGRVSYRTRILNDDEIKALWVDDGFNALTKLLLQLILVTGQRPGEVAGMRWEEIEGRWWTIPAERRGKTGSEHNVYLTDLAVELVDAAKAEVERLRFRRNAARSRAVFETGAGQAMRGDALSRAVNRRDDLSWRPHDLRRTMRTGLSSVGVSTKIAELVIGHEKRGILKVYDQHKFDDERQAALESWERHLNAVLRRRGLGGGHATLDHAWR